MKRVKSGEAVGAVARDLGLVEQTLRNWVKAANAGKLCAPEAKIVPKARWYAAPAGGPEGTPAPSAVRRRETP